VGRGSVPSTGAVGEEEEEEVRVVEDGGRGGEVRSRW